MKTYKNLWEQFISRENFELAYKNSIKHKKKQRQIRIFNLHKERNLEAVRQLVISGKFRTSKYRMMTIYEPKERIIYKLPYSPDRIVQHAIMNILKPVFMRKMISNTFACIEGRGQHKASLKCSEYVRRNKYCVQGDCRKFYPSIDQKILSEMLHKIIKDEKFMKIVDDVIFSFPGGKNCPIGNYCSQWFGNFYLTALDNYIKHELHVKDYERFCDDFLIFGNDKKDLNEKMRKVRYFLHDRLLLECSKLELFRLNQGIDFCGYRHFGKYVLLRKSTARRLIRRTRRIENHREKYTAEYITQSTASSRGILRHCCSGHLRRKLWGELTHNRLLNH